MNIVALSLLMISCVSCRTADTGGSDLEASGRKAVLLEKLEADLGDRNVPSFPRTTLTVLADGTVSKSECESADKCVSTSLRKISNLGGVERQIATAGANGIRDMESRTDFCEALPTRSIVYRAFARDGKEVLLRRALISCGGEVINVTPAAAELMKILDEAN